MVEVGNETNVQWLIVCGISKGATTFSKLGDPILQSRVSLPFYRKKLDRATKFGAVGYVITPYSSKSYVKNWGVSPNFGEIRTPLPVVAPM